MFVHDKYNAMNRKNSHLLDMIISNNLCCRGLLTGLQVTCVLVLRTRPLPSAALNVLPSLLHAGDAIHVYPLLQKGVVWFSILTY